MKNGEVCELRVKNYFLFWILFSSSLKSAFKKIIKIWQIDGWRVEHFFFGVSIFGMGLYIVYAYTHWIPNSTYNEQNNRVKQL